MRSLTLDDPVALRAAHDDPVGFIEHDGLLVIDEVQRAPELFLPIKADVDADPRPGRFLLTGSAQVLALKSLPDALPGRMETIELWPFSQGEISDTPDRFIDAAFAKGIRLTHDSALRRRDYIERAAVGGFPEAVRRTDRRRSAFFESYIDTLIKRDVQEISAIERTPQLRKLLQLLAIRSANLLVPATIASELAIHRSTITRYLTLLETVFLIKTIPRGRVAPLTGRSALRNLPLSTQVCCAISSAKVPRDSPIRAGLPAPSSRTSSSWNSRASSPGMMSVRRCGTTAPRTRSKSTPFSKRPTAV
ncbi:hypothetical protein GCM10027262_67390 [Nocardia tengchongensis]